MHLTKVILIALALLYFASSVLFFIDYLHWRAIIGTIPQPEISYFYGPIKSNIRIGLFLVGTLTAEAYLIYSYKQKE